MKAFILVALIGLLLQTSIHGFSRVRIPRTRARFSSVSVIESSETSSSEADSDSVLVHVDKGTSDNDQDGDDYQGTGSRVYKPRSSRARPEGGGGQQKVYVARGGGTASYSGKGGGGGGSGGGGPAVFLDSPHLLIHYKVPRVKTEFKEDLETRQDELAASSYGGGSWDSGGDSFFDNFSGSGFKKGKGKGAVKEGERKGSEGAKPKTGPGKLDADYDNPDEEYEDDHDDEEEDYYGDESSMSLSSISTGGHSQLRAGGLLSGGHADDPVR